MLDEVLIAGQQQESNKKLISNIVLQQDSLSEDFEAGTVFSNSLSDA